MSKPALEGNLRRFICFRVGFNARFYYPVFTILFLDYGLTLEQFAILNLVWAVTIVVAEVPSGALADLFGRKRLLVAAAVLMVVEMALLAFVPIGASALLFALFLVNRVCSGLAEAAASGADEALAYDTLVALGRESEWARWLEIAGRALSAGFFVAMISGALAYDHTVVNRVLGMLHDGWEWPRETVIRLPVYFTLATACLVLIASLGLREPPPAEPAAADPARLAATAASGIWRHLADPFRQVWQAIRWTLDHRFVLVVIIAGMAIDSVARQLIILASEYYRLIEIPTAWFGFIGAGLALLGIGTARLSRYLVTRQSPIFNFVALSVVLMTGLVGVIFLIPWYGVLFSTCVFILLGMIQFQSSYYINREVPSRLRATVLSIKGLAFNIALGLASLLYTLLIVALRAQVESGEAALPNEPVFTASLVAFPIYFAGWFVLVLVLGRLLIRRRYLCFAKPGPEPVS